jgi:hypothetical protein
MLYPKIGASNPYFAEPIDHCDRLKTVTYFPFCPSFGQPRSKTASTSKLQTCAEQRTIFNAATRPTLRQPVQDLTKFHMQNEMPEYPNRMRGHKREH